MCFEQGRALPVELSLTVYKCFIQAHTNSNLSIIPNILAMNIIPNILAVKIAQSLDLQPHNFDRD